MVSAENTQFFLIAAGLENLEITFNELFAGKLGDRADLWIAPETSHTGAFAQWRQEYEQRVAGFFDEMLLGEDPQN